MKKDLLLKIQAIIITAVFIFLLFSVLVPPATSVHLEPGTISGNSSIKTGQTISFTDINLTIRGEERIPIAFLNFSIHNNANDNLVGYVNFYPDGTEIEDNPSDRFTVINTSTIETEWYDHGNGYGYDEHVGSAEYFGTGYGYGYYQSGFADISLLYDITYTSHSTGTFYWKLTVNSTSSSHSYLFSNRSTSTFKVTTSSSGGGGGGGGIPPANNPPRADPGGPYSSFANSSILFDGSSSTDDDGEITNYSWIFGDGEVGYGAVLYHSYSNPGNYTVSLTVTDNGGTTNTQNTYAIISAELEGIAPDAVITVVSEAMVDESVTFSASQSTDIDGIIVNYTWIFEDGSLKYGESINHIFTHPNIYVVILTVKDDGGKTDTTMKSITILQSTSIDIADGYVIDSDGDGEPDEFYDSETGKKTKMEKQDDGTYLIDTDDDGVWDYIYNPASGQVISYEPIEQEDEDIPLWVIIAIIIAIILIIIGLLFYMEILYFE